MIANTLITSITLAATILTTGVLGRSIPENLQVFYDQVKGGSCPHVIETGMSSGVSGGEYAYCTDPTNTLMWISGQSGLADMDVDCDGSNKSSGRCSNDATGQSMTYFKDAVSKHGISDLDTNIHPYVVLGNSGFNPQTIGIKPLSVVAVVCNSQLFYGIWGDSNGGNYIGEASISLATACFGEKMTGNSGHAENDVLYLAFVGDDAVVDKTANWDAWSFEEFENSLASVGDKMVSGVHI